MFVHLSKSYTEAEREITLEVGQLPYMSWSCQLYNPFIPCLEAHLLYCLLMWSTKGGEDKRI